LNTFDLPFIPGGKYNLDHMTLSLNATHPSNNLTEYDLHSLFGHMQGMATSKVLAKYDGGERPFVLSRSTFAGSGKHVAHWLAGS